MKKLLLLGVGVSMFLTVPLLHADEDTPMATEMKKASKALKMLRKTDPKDWTALAELAREAATAFLNSMSYEAALIKDMPDGEKKDLALADSKRMMGLCYAALCELEIAYLKKDAKLVKEAVSNYKDLKSDGHDEYIAD